MMPLVECQISVTVSPIDAIPALVSHTDGRRWTGLVKQYHALHA